MAVFKNSSGQWVASYGGTKQYYSSQSAAMKAYDKLKVASSGSSGGSSGGSSSGGTSTISQQDYWLKPDESITDYNARIAALRGDTPEELASMQASSNAYAAANPTSAFTARLTKATAPTVASEITNMSQTNIPTTQTSYGSPSTGYAAVTGLDAYSEQRQKDIQAEEERRLKAEQERQKQNKGLFETLLGNQPSRQELKQDAWEEVGIDPNEHFAQMKSYAKEAETLQKNYDTIVAARDQQIADTRGMMASMSFIDNRIAQIKYNAAPELNRISAEINAKAALMEALSGNFGQAQTFINQAVEDATADYKDKVDRFKMLYDMNIDNFNAVEGIYRDSFTARMAEEERAYLEARANAQAVGQLMIANPQAGITITDTLEQAYSKIGINPRPEAGDIFSGADGANYERYYDATSNTYKVRQLTPGESKVIDGSSVLGYDQPGQIGELANTFSLLNNNSRLSNKAMENNLADFNAKMARGDLKGAQALIDKLATENMTGTQKTMYSDYGIIINVVDEVTKMADEFEATNPGVYKTALESLKPFGNASKDPVWLEFVARTQAAINKYRNEIYGASVTGNELKSANISLPEWNRDAFGTIMTKLRAIRDHGSTVRNTLLSDVSGGLLGTNSKSGSSWQTNDNANSSSYTNATDEVNSLLTGSGSVSSATSADDPNFWKDVWNKFKFW